MDAETVIIGAGVIGLACAAELSKKGPVVVIDWQPKFGQDTSSRNSEVIHSGIYYPIDSLKTRFCIEGRNLLYDFCEQQNIPFARCGKLLVATVPDEESYLEKVAQHCTTLSVPFERISAAQALTMSPLIKVTSALYFPTTGVVDSHQLMACLERLAIENGALVAYHHRLKSIERGDGFWSLHLDSPQGEFTIQSERVINCAGLAAASLANQAYQTKRYAHRYCRGRYYMLSSRFHFPTLVYPVPSKDGLGTHVTLSLDGSTRLGPDVSWTEETEYEKSTALYDENWSTDLRNQFAAATRRYCPSVKDEDLSPGFVGIRPKLFIDGKAHPDFVIERQNNFISCLGIESPGLTSALAIAKSITGL